MTIFYAEEVLSVLLLHGHMFAHASIHLLTHTHTHMNTHTLIHLYIYSCVHVYAGD